MKRWKNLWVVGVFLCFFGALFYLSLQALLLERGFLVESKRERIENLMAEKIRLEMEIAQLTSLERIKEIAENRLGMVSPRQVVYLVTGTKTAKGEGETQLALNFEERGEEKGR